MRLILLIFSVYIVMLLGGCTATDSRTDREIISSIAEDLDVGVVTGDMMKIDEHLSSQAKNEGFEANRFLMECSYPDSVTPDFTAWSIKVMGDSAHLAFALLPEDMQYSDTLPRSLVRLYKSDSWKIMSYDLVRNVHPEPPDTSTIAE